MGDREAMALRYLRAKRFVVRAGFGWEVDWQQERLLEGVDDTGFLREVAWTILSAGMSTLVIEKCFERVSCAFSHWSCVSWVVENRDEIRKEALVAFSNPRKIDAVISACEIVRAIGLDRIIRCVRVFGPEWLTRFPYIGPVTCFHLAKNVGFDIPKSDRHLLRIAEARGESSVPELCESISAMTGDPVAVVDVVLWRFAVLNPHYRSYFV